MDSPDFEDSMASKDIFHSHVNKCLGRTLNLLQNYLALCNAHSNEFITHNLWDKMIPDNIRKELWDMTDTELLNLPFRYLNSKSNFYEPSVEIDLGLSGDQSQQGSVKGKESQKGSVEGKESQQGSVEGKESQQGSVEGKVAGDFRMEDAKQDPCKPWKFTCPYLDSAPRARSKKDVGKLVGFPPEWIHENVNSFLKDAVSCHLPSLGVLTSFEQLCEREKIARDQEDNICIHNFMNSKKSHEVDIMADNCALLTKNAGIDVVIDIGSGKGYLSTQLALRYHMTIVGIDAMTTNTKGAIKRARILGKQWNGLVRNAEEEKAGVVSKRGKKWKKRQRNKEKKEDDKATFIVSEIPDEILDSLQDFYVDGNFKRENEDGPEKDFSNVTSGDGSNIISEPLKKGKITTENTKDQKTFIADASLNSEHGDNERQYVEDLSMRNVGCDQKKVKDLKNFKENYYPVTMFVDPSLDLYDMVCQALFHTEHTHSFQGEFTRESTLMLTGLHTCGSLGSSVLDLFVNNPQVKVMCNVACCYHLLEEEFVTSPYSNEDDPVMKPGFPMSSLLREQKVGIGRLARNFASQSLYRLAEEKKLIAKAFPRCLLQKIILDTIGYVRDDWKGLRKLDQKTSSMYEYVVKAFQKLGLPTDKITCELVEKYCKDFKEEERKLAAFCQLKVVLAPCIEAVVLLDRVAYLLEQECVSSVYLTQMFNPTTSPRCYGIIAFKK